MRKQEETRSNVTGREQGDYVSDRMCHRFESCFLLTALRVSAAGGRRRKDPLALAMALC